MDSPDQTPQQQDLLNPRPLPVQPSAALELQQQCRELRTLLNATLLGLIILCLAVDWFIGKQWRLVRQQINEQQVTFTRADMDFRRNRDPEIRLFMDQLHRYAAAHPEFRATILDKYRVALAQYFTTAALSSQPSPIPQGTNFGGMPGR